MRLAIIGSGMIVKIVLPCLSKMSEYSLEAIASREESLSKNQELADCYGIKKVYSNYHDLLLDEDVQIVYVALPNHMHCSVCKEALEKGKHVICEKPFVSNIKQLEQLDLLAKEKGLFLLEAIAVNFYPSLLKAKQLLPSIGKAKLVEGNYGKYSSRYTAFKQGDVLPTFDVNCSGGCLMDINIYNLHLFAFFFGESENVQYFANVERGIDTSGIILINHNQFKAALLGSKDSKGTNSFRIQGEDGTIEITPSKDNTKNVKVTLKDESIEYCDESGVHYMYYEFKEFARIIKNKDYDKANELMKHSKIVMGMATLARRSAGIIFPDDNK